jgi:glycosyltransferase involved in cell wall biosynthesis
MWPTPRRPYLGVFTMRQIDGLRSQGAEVTVLAIDGMDRRQYFHAAIDLIKLNRGEARYDLIHAHTGHCGLLACLQIRYPVVMSYVGYDLHVHLGDAETLRTTLERFVFRWISVLLAGTIVKSRRGMDYLPRASVRRNVVVPNGVDRELFRPRPRTEARALLGWDYEQPTVLFAADPRRWEKRFSLCEEAVARARETIPSLQLAIASDVPPAEMPLWYAAADALILTSTDEHSPNVVKEAMACDLPVVTVEVGDVREVIGGASLCYICPARAHSLAAALVHVLHALPERSNGRAVTEWLALPAISERLVATYANALHRGPGPLGFRRRRRARRPG